MEEYTPVANTVHHRVRGGSHPQDRWPIYRRKCAMSGLPRIHWRHIPNSSGDLSTWLAFCSPKLARGFIVC